MFGSENTRSSFNIYPSQQSRSRHSKYDTPAHHRVSFTSPPPSSRRSCLPPARSPPPLGSPRDSSTSVGGDLVQPLHRKRSLPTLIPSFIADRGNGSGAHDDFLESSCHSPTLAKPNLPGAIPQPYLSVNDAFSRIRNWISGGRPGPFLTIHCTPDVFTSTAKLLEAQDLPRITRDYDPKTMTWHIRGRPHFLHELGNIVLRRIEDLTHPRLTESKFAPLVQKLVWNSGSNTSKLPALGYKEPDASLGMINRALPTIVIEVGYSESRAKLRLDAARWLQTGQLDESERKRKRGDKEEVIAAPKLRPVMLVILISFEGQRPSEEVGIDYSEQDYEDNGGVRPKPLSIYAELWRLRASSDSRPATRSNSPDNASPALYPEMCERKRFFPEDTDSDDSITLFATDIFGTDKVRDSRNVFSFKIPLAIFREAYAVKLSMFQAERMEADGKVVDDDDSFVVVTSDEEEEHSQEVLGQMRKAGDHSVESPVVISESSAGGSHDVLGDGEPDTETPGETKRLRL